jgi:hypothetical protein
MSVDQKALDWLGGWLAALLGDGNVDETELRVAVALVVLAIQRNGLTADGFRLDATNEDLAEIAGLRT